MTPEEETEFKRDTPLVMVTDDSVTVRKVTTRLLERNGYEVVTAKDGMDAIAKLEDGTFARTSAEIKVTIGGCGG